MSDVLDRQVTAADIQRGSTQPEGLGGRRSLFILARQGLAIAQISLADLYYEGRGVRQNYYKATLWYRRAAKQGDAIAQRILGYCYLDGRGVEKNDGEAFKWHWRAAEQGDVRGRINVGAFYQLGQGVEQDDAKGAHWFQLAAEEQGDADAQVALANCYAYGTGVKQDDAKAAYWYQRAAEQGHADAQRMLGAFYQLGRGVEQDDAASAHWYARAAEQGDSSSQAALGFYYQFGIGVEQDDAASADWYARAAKQENALAQEALGHYYLNGRGVEQDDAKAAYWFQRAAQQGDANAQYNFAVCYTKGQGVEQDDAKAAYWYRLAAEQGHAQARGNLSAKTSHTEQEIDHNPVEKLIEEAQNEQAKGFAVPLNRFMESEIIFKATNELLEKVEVAEQDRAAFAPVAKLFEDYHNNPEAWKATLAAMTAAQATGADMPGAGKFAQLVGRSRRASAGPQKPPVSEVAVPDRPPEYYGDRLNPKEGVDKFLQRVYKPWIVDGTLTIPRDKLRILDVECDLAISKWMSNHRGKPFPMTLIDNKEPKTEGPPPPYTVDQIQISRRIARWADRHPHEVIGR